MALWQFMSDTGKEVEDEKEQIVRKPGTSLPTLEAGCCGVGRLGHTGAIPFPVTAP